MVDQFFAKSRPLVVGTNHRTSSLMLRDRLFVEDSGVPAFLGRVRERGIDQAMVLSTCDRVEVQAVHARPTDAARDIAQVMAEHAGIPRDELDGQLYVLSDAAAVRHIFTVAASLDSLVVGESEILGQVKACHRLARDAGMSGSELEAVLQAAYGAAKRVRSETAIGERPVSIAAAAVQVSRDLHGALEECSGLVLGAGEMAQLVARSLTSAGLGHLGAAHPNEKRAEAVARALDCHAASFDDLAMLLGEADIVLCAVGARRHVVDADMVRAALRRRRHKPIFIVDADVPGDVEPAVSRLDEAFVYDLDDLERIAMEGRASRESEAQAAWRIVEAEEARFLRRRGERAAVPALTLLRDRFEEERQRALAEAGDDADKATRLLVGRLLHGPMEVMRTLAADQGPPDARGGGAADWQSIERALKRLFRLGEARDGEERDGEE